MEGLQRIGKIAPGEIQACTSRQAVDALALLVVGKRQIVAEIASLLDKIVREEGQAGSSADIRLFRDARSRRFDDPAGNRAGGGIHRLEVGFQEAPLHLGIIGEGLAALVADAGRLALIEREILLGAQVEAEIIGVLDGDDVALWRRRQKPTGLQKS